MRNLVIYKDNQFPRYLQIMPAQAEAVLVPVLNLKGEVIGHKPGRLSKSGTIDIVTVPDQPVKVGDEFRTNISIIKVDRIVETTAAKGQYSVPAMWMRCEFSLVRSLLS